MVTPFKVTGAPPLVTEAEGLGRQRLVYALTALEIRGWAELGVTAKGPSVYRRLHLGMG